MLKIHFLCPHHRRWLSDKPEAAANFSLQAYSRGLDLAEGRNYLDAIKQAGAAFETSEIVLKQEARVTASDIRRLADSGVLLAQLLYQVEEARFARAVLTSAITRFEQLLVAGVERKAVLMGCQRLLEVGKTLNKAAAKADAHAPSSQPGRHIH